MLAMCKVHHNLEKAVNCSISTDLLIQLVLILCGRKMYQMGAGLLIVQMLSRRD